jgi:hypothetical protein
MERFATVRAVAMAKPGAGVIAEIMETGSRTSTQLSVEGAVAFRCRGNPRPVQVVFDDAQDLCVHRAPFTGGTGFQQCMQVVGEPQCELFHGLSLMVEWTGVQIPAVPEQRAGATAPTPG